MLFDLHHNKIVSDTLTVGFEASVREVLLPMLEEKYEGFLGIQMYEDYISDNFLIDGEWYYPMTVVTEREIYTQWIKWQLNGDFDNRVPYAYSGEELIPFSLVEPVAEFEAKIEGRSRFCESGIVKIKVEAAAPSPTFLSGKYSQTFVDELARQITPAVCEAASVEGFAESPIELALVFAPETYMEHTSENVTYRRLLMTDGASAPRDFWIKWTRLDGAGAYTVSDHVSGEAITFEIGEEVHQKIREKEYRNLIRLGRDKYHAAMGKRNVTEWRDIIKRAIRRGELTRVEKIKVSEAENDLLAAKLAEIIGADIPKAQTEPEVEKIDGEFAMVMQKLARAAGESEYVSEDGAVEFTETEDGDKVNLSINIDDSMFVADKEETELEVRDEAEEEFDLGDEAEEEFDLGDEADDDDAEFTLMDDEEEAAEAEDDDEFAELEAYYSPQADLEIDEGVIASDDEEAAELDEITRMAMEALRIVSESTSKNAMSVVEPEVEAEPEAEEIEEEIAEETAEETEVDYEDPTADEFENEEYTEALADVRALEPDDEEVVVESAPAVIDEAKMRAEIEARIRLEYESRARAKAEEEAKRLRAEQEQLRLENERLQARFEREAREQLRREEQRRAEEEKLRAQIEMQLRAEQRERERLADFAKQAVEEQRRLEEERARLEKIQKEEAERLEKERRAAEEARRIEAERQAEAERIRRDAEEAAKARRAAEGEDPNANYTYVSKTVRLMFRRSVDPNVTARIYEIIKATIEYYGKEKVYLKIKATVPDTNTVCLEFVKIPMEEMELLSNIIKVLGNSGLGIAKAIVE